MLLPASKRGFVPTVEGEAKLKFMTGAGSNAKPSSPAAGFFFVKTAKRKNLR